MIEIEATSPDQLMAILDQQLHRGDLRQSLKGRQWQ